jgi:hypothetical protein
VPFLAPEDISSTVLRSASEAIAEVPAFSYRLAELGRWPETTYLSPEPTEPFVKLTMALWTRFPSFPPYAGKHDGIVPHLTVSDGSRENAEAAERELQPELHRLNSIQARCVEVELIENATGVWRTMHVLPLANNDA